MVKSCGSGEGIHADTSPVFPEQVVSFSKCFSKGLLRIYSVMGMKWSNAQTGRMLVFPDCKWTEICGQERVWRRRRTDSHLEIG